MTLLFRKSRNAWRGTPAFSASTVISAMHCVTTPSITLWQILTMRDSSPSPTYDEPCPIIARYGAAASYAAFGPETTKVSLPALITLALPDTGAESSPTPFAARILRRSAEPSSEIDEHSTTILGLAEPDSSPFGPAMTSLTSS